METAPEPIQVAKRSSVSDAKQAYFEGDFERCLEICSGIRIGSLATASEIALLRARAYLRTGRPQDAQAAIVDSLETHTTLDASLTAQLLVATARIKQDDADTGIAVLLEAATRAGEAHLAVRSEIAFTTAYGYWVKRDLEAAEQYLEQVDPRSDIIHARALDLQAWCHVARRDHYRSAQAFRATLLRLDDCRAADEALSGNAVSTLAILGAELFDADIARFADARASRMDWSGGFPVQRYLALAHRALYEEFAGDTFAAYTAAASASENAPTVAFEALGWALRSSIARNAGEVHIATLFARRAQAAVETLEPRELIGEERFALLSVAECCAHFDLDKASELVARYWGLAPVDAMLALSGDPRLVAEETYISGVVAQAKGELERAQTCFRKAFEIFREIGYKRRAVIAAHALVRLVPDENARCYVDAELAGIDNYITRTLAPAGDTLTIIERHPVVASLPRAQREVVALICAGKTNREIAALRNVSEQTIKNLLSKHVFRAFGVTSRAALVSLCLRGLTAAG